MTRRWAYVSLFAILALGLVLRLRFVTGVVFNDDLGYAQSALDLLNGHLRMGEWPGGQSRIGLIAPVALSYWLFGPSETSTLLFPWLCSLASIALVFGLASWFADERAGLIAAFVWAVFPLDIQAATALLPDGPVTLLAAAAVWCFLRAAESASPRANYTAAAACLLWAALIKPTGLFALGFILIYLVLSPRAPYRRTAVAAMLLIAAGVSAYYAVWGGMEEVASRLPASYGFRAVIDTALDWTLRLTREPLFAAFTPLAIVATAVLLMQPTPRASVALLWAGVLFVFFEVGSVSPFRYLPVSSELRAGQVLFVLLPFAVISGVALRALVSPSLTRAAVVAAALVVAGVAATVGRGGPAVSWLVTGLDPDHLPFAAISTMALAIATFGAIVVPGVVPRVPALWRAPALGLLLAGIGLASLHPAQVKTLETAAAWHENLKTVAAFLEPQPAYPIFVENRILASRLNVATRFKLGFDFYDPATQSGRIRIAPEQLDLLPPDAFIVVDDEHVQTSPAAGWGVAPGYLKSPPPDWALMLTAGAVKGFQTRVYRLSLAAAQHDLAIARTAAASAATAENLLAVVRAASGAREYCTAAGAWLRLLAVSKVSAEPIDPSGMLRRCGETRPDLLGPNLLKNADFSAGTDGWSQHPDSRVTRTVEPGEAGQPARLHLQFRGGNWAVVSQGAVLEPDAAYVYRMRVRSTAPVAALYWQADVSRVLEDGKTYQNWTELTLAFVTPHWNGQRTLVYCSPVLIHAPGDVWISDVQLRQLRLDAPVGSK